MTDINAQDLLSPDEIAALLCNGAKDDAEPMTSVLRTNDLSEQGYAAAEYINRALLAEYRTETGITFCGQGFSCPQPPFLRADLHSSRGSGYILFSAGFAETVVSRILAGNAPSFAGRNLITPAVAAVMREVAAVICRGVSALFSPQAADWQCSACTEQSSCPDGKCQPFCFSSDGANMWLLPPEPEFLSSDAVLSADEKTALQQIARRLPLEAEAVVCSRQATLREISRWQKGYFLPLGIEKNAEISILCGNKTLFKGILGRKLRRVAVKITQKVPWK